MPKLSVLQDYFSKLEDIVVPDIQQWLGQNEVPIILENRIGNRMLYPQVIPQTPSDMDFDFAIIRKVIEANQTKFYNKNLKRIDIPEEFLQHFLDIKKLVIAFIDALILPGITTFWIKSVSFAPRNLGTLIRPENLKKGDTITIGIGDKQYPISVGSLVVIPISKSRADMTFTSATATLIGKKILSIEIVTGQFGLIVDTRI
ncbi:MAG: hypothetical protein WCV81_04025 [Microgenomates group bacterium]|jgi:hypothetical protein